jgi:hypothetical protein
MGVCIGVDEAGLGPNLGPFVVVATVWDTPGPPADCDVWSALAPVVTPDPQGEGTRLVLADSKAVFKPKTGLALLERTVLAMLAWSQPPARTLPELLARMGADLPADVPWHQGPPLPLPRAHSADEISRAAEALRRQGALSGLHLQDVVARVVHPVEFNRLLERHRNKAEAVAAIHREVTRSAWLRAAAEPTLLVSDKLGGRTFYAAYLSELTEGAWVTIVEEGPLRSAYRCAQTEFRFEPRAERYAPVALASMVAKYLREVHMQQFNDFWSARLPHLRPTQGYPVDAGRFFAQIESLLPELALTRGDVWRQR